MGNPTACIQLGQPAQSIVVVLSSVPLRCWGEMLQLLGSVPWRVT